MTPLFPNHGQFELSLDGDILVNRARGPWNTELTLAYGEAVAERVKSLAGKPWGVLAFVSGDPIHTPDAKNKMVATLVDHRAKGRCGTALVYDAPDNAAILRHIHTALYRDAGEPFLLADNEATARSWLKQRLAQQ